MEQVRHLPGAGSYRLPSVKGFSLAEVLFALALIGIMLVCLIQLLILEHFALRQENEIFTATDIASEQLARIYSYCDSSGTDIVPLSATFSGRDNNPTINAFPPGPYPSTVVAGTTYFVKVETVNQDYGSGVIVREVNVTVEWESKEAFSYEKAGGAERFWRSLTLTNVLPDS